MRRESPPSKRDKAASLKDDAAKGRARMIILVGGGGFLGSHLCELLSLRHQRVTVVYPRNDAPHVADKAPLVDVMSASEFASAAGDHAIKSATAIVYLAWQSVPATFANEPSREVSSNVLPAFDFFLRVARLSPQTKIVFLSSGGTVYRCEGADRKDEAAPVGPISAYGLGKLMAEEALRFVGRTLGLPYAILRVSNAIGRWQHHDAQGIVAIALRAARDGVPVRLFGDGNQVRDFVDADDVAEAIYAACLQSRFAAATWNIGSGVGLAIREALHKAEGVIGQRIPVEYAPPRKLDVSHIVLDCGRAAEDLGWTARTAFEQSVSDIWQSLKPPSKRAV
jgi:UDP-glucose 4-epimerase